MKIRGSNQKKSPGLGKIVPYRGRDRKIIFRTGCAITVFFIGLFVYRPAFITFLDQKYYDVCHRALEDQGPARPVIVTIDDPSLEAFGQWPWPRDLLARLCSAIARAAPSAVGMDILMSEPDRASLLAAFKILQDRGVIVSHSLTDSLDPSLDNDKILARVLRRGPFVLACKLLKEKTIGLPPGLLPLKVSLVTPTTGIDLFQWFPAMHGILAPLPLFIQAARGYGFVNSVSDNDGIIRRTPFIAGYQGRFYPSLSLAALMLSMNTDKVVLKAGPAGLSSVSIKHLTIPVSPQGHLLLHFRKNAADFTVISARDLLEGKADPSIMKDRIVFLGAWASGLGETHATPLAPYFFGVGIHATAVDNALNGNLLSAPPWVKGVEWVLILITGIICTLMLTYFKPWPCNLFLALAATGFWFSGLFFLRHMHLYISMTYPFLTLFVVFSLLSVLRFRIEEKRMLRRTRDMAAAQNLTLLGITALAGTRDKETGLHIRRTALFVKLLAKRLSLLPRYRHVLDDHTIELMFKSAPMHDIGKVGVPDAVLKKPGKLSQAEFVEIQKHTDHGWHAIEEAEKMSGTDQETSFLKVSKEIILSHHEKWDGSGYNQGLKGEEIPLSARIMAVADVYDALTARRVYKDAFDHTMARKTIIEGKGTHFDPEVVDAFLALEKRFEEIAIQMADDPGEYEPT